MKILLACQTATNKGDRAIAEYVIARLLEQGHEVVLSTTRPALWSNLISEKVSVIGMGYKSVYQDTKNVLIRKVSRVLSRFVYDKILFSSLISSHGKHTFCNFVSKEFIAAVKEADLVIVTGGHHITSIREKNALFQFTYDIGLISLYAKRYVLWSQTIGPLKFTSKKAKNFIENIIRNAEKVFVRDENSVKCIEQIYGDVGNVAKTYDSVFGYGSIDFPDVADREKKVGLAIFDGLKKAFKTYDVIAGMLDRFASEGYSIEFFRMEHSDYEQGNIDQIISHMKQSTEIKIHPFMTTTEEHLKEVASCRCFIGYKTHSVIMALATATPLIAIAYHKKTEDFMNDFGLGDYAISDEALDYDRAEQCMVSLDANIEQIHKQQKNVAKRIAQQIKNDLHEMI